MPMLSPQGQQLVDDLSRRHGFSPDAVTHMLIAVWQGNGTMAQFSHPEFGGGGQWMQGGMLMLGDMFNHALKGRVDALCNELAGVLAGQPGLLTSGSFQSQRQGGADFQEQTAGGYRGESGLFAPDPNARWWPPEFGVPNATGSQNQVKYAWFAQARRLAVQTGGETWVYDTLDHQIGGFSQQQGMGGSISFASQYGTVNLATLPVVSRNGQPVPAPRSAPGSIGTPMPPAGPVTSPSGGDPLAALRQLAELHAQGILTDAEFSAKKAELLARL